MWENPIKSTIPVSDIKLTINIMVSTKTKSERMPRTLKRSRKSRKIRGRCLIHCFHRGLGDLREMNRGRRNSNQRLWNMILNPSLKLEMKSLRFLRISLLWFLLRNKWWKRPLQRINCQIQHLVFKKRKSQLILETVRTSKLDRESVRNSIRLPAKYLRRARLYWEVKYRPLKAIRIGRRNQMIITVATEVIMEMIITTTTMATTTQSTKLSIGGKLCSNWTANW